MSVSTTWGDPDTKVTYGDEDRREKESNKDGYRDKERRSHGKIITTCVHVLFFPVLTSNYKSSILFQ